MKDKELIAKEAGLVGAGVGLVLFALGGILYGSLIGGAIGLDIINSMSPAAEPTLMARVVLAASMLAGVIVSGILFVVAFSTAGWITGYTVGMIAEPKHAGEMSEAKDKAR